MNWIKITDRLPPQNMVVNTKIDKDNVVSNEQKLIRVNSLYFLEDKSMYVYYTPTHWSF